MLDLTVIIRDVPMLQFELRVDQFKSVDFSGHLLLQLLRPLCVFVGDCQLALKQLDPIVLLRKLRSLLLYLRLEQVNLSGDLSVQQLLSKRLIPECAHLHSNS